jgi:Rrf2 family protein
MKRNSRLSLALHTLGHMAGDPERMRTSADIAEHAGTNPVVVRRVLGRLRDANLLASVKGHAGGWRLARSPHQITLADVYVALNETLIASEDEAQASDCSVENLLRNKVESVMRDIEHDLIERLAKTTIMELSDTGNARK